MGPVWQNPWFVKPPRPLSGPTSLPGRRFGRRPAASRRLVRRSLLGTAELGGSALRTEFFWRWKLPAGGSSSITEAACPAATWGDTWRCDNPACRAWTWVTTSRERCFAFEAPAPRAARKEHGFLLAGLGPGHREVHARAPGDAADGRVALARAAQPPPGPVEPRPQPVGPARYLLPPPPPPNRGQPRGRTGAGPAAHSRNPNQDFRGIDRELAAGDYREGGRAAVVKALPLFSGPAHSPRRSQPPSGGSALTRGGSGRGASPGRRAHLRGAAAEFCFSAAEADHEYPPLRSATECWVVQEGKKVRLGMLACLAKPPPRPSYASCGPHPPDLRHGGPVAGVASAAGRRLCCCGGEGRCPCSCYRAFVPWPCPGPFPSSRLLCGCRWLCRHGG